MADIQINDFSIKVSKIVDEKIVAVLEECSGELESQTKKNSRADTGKTRNSFRHEIVESEKTAYIGSSEQNAIWEEFGTGEYALEDNGRKGGWFYVDDEGKGHFTYGKTPTRAFWNAYISKKNAIINRIRNAFKEM